MSSSRPYRHHQTPSNKLLGRGRGRGVCRGRGISTTQAPPSIHSAFPTLHCDKRDTSFGCHNNNWSNNELIKYCFKYHVMFIMRGLPGSGKSTITEGIQSLFNRHDVVICSADDFRTDSDGNYVFDPDQLESTHRQCKQKAQLSCQQNQNVVIIDNTNIQSFEYEPYLKIAKRFGYPVIFLSMKAGDANVLSKRNRHYVPLNKIKQMQSNYKEDPIPYFYNWTVPSSEGQRLKRIIQNIIQKCYKGDSMFESFFKSSLRLSPKDLYRAFNTTTFSCMSLHVTTAYTSEFNVPPQKSRVYRHSKLVKELLGIPTSLKIVGIVLTKKCLAARVLLTEQQKTVWGSDDSLTGERNLLAFESTNLKVKYLTDMLKGLALDSNHLSFKQPAGCLKPSHKLGCTAHITLGTRGNNRPVEAKEALHRLVYLEASTLASYEGDIPRNAAFRLYDEGVLALYLKRPINVQALFCGYYEPDKRTKTDTKP